MQGKKKYLDLPDLVDIGLFFDEIGNLNAALELDKSLKKRREVAINKLTATGGSVGLHITAISQFATKEAFLPSLARVNCSDAVIMLAGAADSADERRFLMSGFADLPKRNYKIGQGVARIITSGKNCKHHISSNPLGLSRFKNNILKSMTTRALPRLQNF